MSNIAIVLNSGGLDSLVTCAIMKQQGWELHSLYVDLGQQNGEPTKRYAKKIADKYCVSHEEIKLGNRSFNKVVELNGKPFLGLPQQAVIIHTIGGFIARQNDIDYVVSGQKDEAVASDFHATLTKLFASDKLQDGIVFLRPVNNLIQIQDVVAKGEEMGLTMEEMKNTHSCNTNPPCGTCRKCIQRKEAGLDD